MAERAKKCKEGLAPWMATFADMMSLLMCFFVLLLSFAEVDAVRFKKMAEAMKDAFGVQREIPAMEIVKGTSVIKQEFSPGLTTPSVLDEIRQETIDDMKENLKMEDGTMDEEVMKAVAENIQKEVREQALELNEILKKEVEEGLISVETEDTKIIIRIREKGSFPSGSADLNPGFLEVMERISAGLERMPGKIIVAGHTDNVPISTARYRSNWELSSGRAVTVVHALLEDSGIEPRRVLIEGYADSAPLVENDTPENRARNRRVELILVRGDDEVSDEILHFQEKPETES